MDYSVREGSFDRKTFHNMEKEKKTCCRGFTNVMNVVAAFFTETFSMIYTACAFHIGKKKNFTYHGMNPTSLTSEQAKKTAILALHGDKGNGGYWKKLAKQTAKEGFPTFAPNIKYDDDHPKAHEKALRDFVKEMRALYEAHGEQLNLIVVGHSKGVIVGADVLLNKPVKHCTVKKVISLAGRLKDVPSLRIRACHPVLKPFVDNARHALKRNKLNVKLYTIASGQDWKVPQRAVHIGCSVKKKTINCWSHLGAVYSSKAIRKAIKFIKD